MSQKQILQMILDLVMRKINIDSKIFSNVKLIDKLFF